MSIFFLLSALTPRHILDNMRHATSASMRDVSWSETHPGGVVTRKHHFVVGSLYEGTVHNMQSIDAYFQTGGGDKEMKYFDDARINAWVWRLPT